MLIVPPWINKFYILDLTPEKSFIKWCVDNGVTVFVVSWVNPDGKLAEKSFEQYMREGVMAALDAVEMATGEKKIHTIGYCVGGTLLAITLAYLATKQDDPRRLRHALHGAGRFHSCRRPHGVRRQGPHRAIGRAHARARLS